MSRQLLALVAVMVCCNTVFGLYFDIDATERKCLIAEVPDDTTVIVHYKVELYDPRANGFTPSSPGIGMHVEIRDSVDKIILSRVYRHEARLLFTSQMPGEHVICMYANGTSWFSGAQLRVHLDIQVGEQAIDYASVAQKEKLTKLQLRIRQLLDQVDQIAKEKNYQRYREERFRQTIESTNSRMLWWSVAQTVVLVIVISVLAKLDKKLSDLPTSEADKQKLNECTDDPSNKVGEFSGDFLNNKKGSDIYILQSKINYNCLPNARSTFPYSNDIVALKAIQSLLPNGDICTSYLDEYQLEKQKILKENDMLACQCPNCQLEAKDPDETSKDDGDKMNDDHQ